MSYSSWQPGTCCQDDHRVAILDGIQRRPFDDVASLFSGSESHTELMDRYKKGDLTECQAVHV